MLKRRQALLASIVPLALIMSACGGTDSAGEVGLPAPVIVPIAELKDAEVEISISRPLVITVENAPEEWTAGSTENQEIAEFQPGRVEGTASFNPGFQGLMAGSTVASITDPHSGEELSFTLNVSP